MLNVMWECGQAQASGTSTPQPDDIDKSPDKQHASYEGGYVHAMQLCIPLPEETHLQTSRACIREPFPINRSHVCMRH